MTGGWILAAAIGLLLSTSALLYPAHAAVQVIAPDEILRSSTLTLNGDLHFMQEDGSTVRFITDVKDSEIANPGDGLFHPASIETVDEALSALDLRFAHALNIRVFILPYPRSGQLRSTASRGAVYISPGVLEYTEEQIHFLVAHEAGHVIHQLYLKDQNAEGWEMYRRIRGIEDYTIYNAQAEHANRPHEIFAEDFRILFGGSRARATGHENRNLADPRDVSGLADFMASLLPLVSAAPAIEPLVIGPNPFRPGQHLTFRIPEQGKGTVEILDISGRRVYERDFQADGRDRFTIVWDGCDAAGRVLSAGAYFVKLTTATQGFCGRITLLR
ncbi:MAG: T9SS type A sorting domain-containing protein [Candidatus Eisenbacteria bacterium]|uniref:T9SS type A sorting domain-containing protein n=1 Tax=Eiseniibacteriota bacterium TaxID=2212470 RepID=A0A948RVL9_UNCEI|nr:T9SS type A sorting domain-containing protein [Candidatus Eisenbacteria bacterium]